MTSETRVTHTPGPWHADLVAFNRHAGATIQAEGRPLLATVYWNWTDGIGYAKDAHDHQNNAETVANARLIASAPDLLAALESLTQLGTDDNGAIIVGPRGWELAQAAIRRARGED